MKRRLAVSFLVVLNFSAVLARGEVTYSLHLGGVDPGIAAEITASMAEAVPLYNKHGSFNKHLNVYYSAGVPTAQANYNGDITFGGSRNTRVALHEMGHTVGIGQHSGYAANMVNGVWRGFYGNTLAVEIGSPYPDGIHGDSVHCWPWGLNQNGEDGYLERIKHVQLMAAMRCDMGIMAYSKEAEHTTVEVGETAVFSVESPLATSYQWHKNGVPLSNGGDITGATSPTLTIANADLSDEGSYHCAATGAGETLNSRPRQLLIDRFAGHWAMDGNAIDSVGANHGIVTGTPTYPLGQIGQAIDLDGVDDYVTLPAGVANYQDLTVATWVDWDGGGNWQRIFDFGTGTSHYLFLTPKSGGGTLRFALKDGWGTAEQIVETSVLPTGQWVHLAVVLRGDLAVLYVDGVAAATSSSVTIDPIGFSPTQNYIGESQFSLDPLFNGRIDDFRIYNHGLSGAEIWDLWGQSSNAAPVFNNDPLILPNAMIHAAYAGQTLSNHVSDADGDLLTYTKLSGPAWLSVAADGQLSGTPGSADYGPNTFLIRAADPAGASSDVQVRIRVDLNAGPVAHWDFNDPALGSAHGVALPDSDALHVWREAATDKSGHGNHLTTWEYDWAGFDWSTNSPAGDFSIVAAGDYPGAYTWSVRSSPSGIDGRSVFLTNFTVEAVFTTTGSGYRTVVGRDARNVSSGNAALAAFYMGLDPDNHPRTVITDIHGNTTVLTATSVTVANDNATWYHMAVVKDGTSVSIHWDGTEVATTAIAPGPLAIGVRSGIDWHPGGWSVGRGLYDGGHTDRWYGHIDGVALSGAALSPVSFVLGSFDLWMAYYGLAGAPFEGDADLNGIINGAEYFLGAIPTNAASPARILTLSDDLQSVTYPFNPSAAGVSGMVEWTTDLAAGIWTDSGVTYETNASPDEITAIFATGVADEVYFRLKLIR